MKTVLIDTNYLVALMVKKDKSHAAALKFASTFRGKLVMPELVMVELFFVVNELTESYKKATEAVYQASQSNIQMIALIPSDYPRIYEIMNKYQSSEFDFVDAAMMTLAERLNITEVVTFDRRDYSIFRPKHVDYLTLLP